MKNLDEVKIKVRYKLERLEQTIETTAYEATDKQFLIWWVLEALSRITSSTRLRFREKLIELLGEKK